MNRDTVYSATIVDISNGATLTVPDAGKRYMSIMLVNDDKGNQNMSIAGTNILFKGEK